MFELSELESLKVPEKENLMLVDCLNLSFRWMHRGQTDFAGEYLRTITSLAKSYGAKHVILLSDKGSSSFRKEIHPEYKGDRKKKHEAQSEEEKKKFAEFFEGYEKALELASKSYPLVRFSKVEADDLGAYIVKNYSPRYKHTWLISTDADWDLMLSSNVSRFSFVSRKEYQIENMYENSGCDSPEQLVSMKALQGDSGDSIDGIAGVGNKRAYNLIRTYGSALGLVDALPLDTKKVVENRINQSEDLILRNLMLVDLLEWHEEAIMHPDQNNLVKLKEICDEYLD